MAELHGVFAVTIYGDKIRVSHYGNWNEIIQRWDLLDLIQKRADLEANRYKLVKYFCVRSWEDPEWNLSRYRSLDTLKMEEENV